MKRNVIILLLTLAALNLSAKTLGEGTVDPFIEAKFQKEFGSSVKPSWQVIEDISVATFTDQGRVKQVFYFDDGQMLGWGKSIDRNLLPDEAAKSIKNRFNSAIIQSVYEFKSNDAPTRYFVYLYTESHFRIVAVNEFGDIQVYKKMRLNH